MFDDLAQEPVQDSGQTATAEPQIENGQAEAGQETTVDTKPPAGYIPERDYKALQTEFGRRNEAMKALASQLDKYGGVEAVLKKAELANDPRVQQLLQSQNDPYANADDDTKKAIAVIKDIVNQEAARIADEKLGTIRQTVDPWVQRAQKAEYDAQIAKFEQEVGADWREVEGTMSELARYLPRDAMTDVPPVEALKILHLAALQKEGKLAEYQSKQYQKTISQKKTQSQGRGSSGAGETGSRTYKTLESALDAAMRQHGVA